MFYLKHEHDGVTVKMEFIGEAFTICPKCGKEFAVDLVDFIKDPKFDLYGTSLYCRECSAQNRKNEAQ